MHMLIWLQCSDTCISFSLFLMEKEIFVREIALHIEIRCSIDMIVYNVLFTLEQDVKRNSPPRVAGAALV